MDELVAQVVHSEFARAGPQVPLVVEVALQISIYACHERVGPYVELAAVDEKRIVNVALHDARALLRRGGLLNNFFDFAEVFGHRNAIALVSAFARLDDPNVVLLFGRLNKELAEALELRVVQASLHMKSHWQSVKDFFPPRVVVILHVNEESLLVAEVIVVLKLVVKLVRVLVQLLICLLFDLLRHALICN